MCRQARAKVVDPERPVQSTNTFMALLLAPAIGGEKAATAN
jgi:hypothetical protein